MKLNMELCAFGKGYTMKNRAKTMFTIGRIGRKLFFNLSPFYKKEKV